VKKFELAPEKAHGICVFGSHGNIDGADEEDRGPAARIILGEKTVFRIPNGES
jgi:hypothetical protein